MRALHALGRGNRRAAMRGAPLALPMKARIAAGFLGSGPAASTADTIWHCRRRLGAPRRHQLIPPHRRRLSREGDHGKGSGKDGGQCSFSSLTMAAMGGADAPLLALALAFILLLGLLPAIRLPFARADHLQPPLRGPPATA